MLSSGALVAVIGAERITYTEHIDLITRRSGISFMPAITILLGLYPFSSRFDA